MKEIARQNLQRNLYFLGVKTRFMEPVEVFRPYDETCEPPEFPRVLRFRVLEGGSEESSVFMLTVQIPVTGKTGFVHRLYSCESCAMQALEAVMNGSYIDLPSSPAFLAECRCGVLDREEGIVPHYSGD